MSRHLPPDDRDGLVLVRVKRRKPLPRRLQRWYRRLPRERRGKAMLAAVFVLLALAAMLLVLGSRDPGIR